MGTQDTTSGSIASTRIRSEAPPADSNSDTTDTDAPASSWVGVPSATTAGVALLCAGVVYYYRDTIKSLWNRLTGSATEQSVQDAPVGPVHRSIYGPVPDCYGPVPLPSPKLSNTFAASASDASPVTQSGSDSKEKKGLGAWWILIIGASLAVVGAVVYCLAGKSETDETCEA